MALALVGVTACSRQLVAETEHAEGVDFSQYRTYRWITDDPVLIRPGAGNPNIRSVQNELRIRRAIDSELAAKGLRRVEGDEAQLDVAFSLGTKLHYEIQGGSTPLDMVAGPAASVTRGELTIYLFDRARAEQVWSASTKKDLEPGADPDRVIDAAVRVLLAGYPPAH